MRICFADDFFAFFCFFCFVFVFFLFFVFFFVCQKYETTVLGNG